MTNVERSRDEERYPGLAGIRALIEDLERFKLNSAGYPSARPSDCRPITNALRAFVVANRRMFAWADDPIADVLLLMVRSLYKSTMAAYPTEILYLRLVEAEILVAAGRHMEALAIASPLANRPYLIEDDYTLVMRSFALDIGARLGLGRIAEVESVAYGRMRYLARWRPRTAWTIYALLGQGLAVGRLFGQGWTMAKMILQVLARIEIESTIRLEAGSLVSRWMALLAAGAGGVVVAMVGLASRLSGEVPRLQVREEGISPSPDANSTAGKERRVLISRAMGGIGDIMMMTPGLHALAQRSKSSVHFATRRQFFPVLANNPDVKLVDIESDIDLATYSQWHNLSNCPAAAYEARARPQVRKGRVELFAGGMRVSKKELDRYGIQPRYVLSDGQREFAKTLRERGRAKGLALFGIQPYSREDYRYFPGIFDVIARIAAENLIVILHTAPTQAAAHPNIVSMHGHSLDQSIAALSACDYFLSVDSGFFHIAAAFDIPAVGIFGPTGANARSHANHRHLIVEPPHRMPCVPCWRNEDIPCYLSKTEQSACLNSITVEQVTASVKRLKDMYPVDLQAADSRRMGDAAI